MTSIVSNILVSFFCLSFAHPRLVPGSSRCISARSLLLARSSLRPHGMQMHTQTQTQTQTQCKPNHASFLSFAGYFDARQVDPAAAAHELGYLIVPLPSFPGRPFQGVERASQNKSPRLVSNKQGGKQHPTPSHPRRPDNPKVGSVPSRQPVAGVVLHTILSAHLRASARRCSSHLPPLTSPLGSGRGALGVTPNPHPFTIHTLLVIPRFSCCFYCFSFSLLCSFCLLRTSPPLPCPSLLHLFLDRLTASSRLALHHLRQGPPGQPAHPSPTSRHHWNAQ